jgi:hypothetical protein
VNLRLQAAADLKTILEDSVAGFGWAIRVTDPGGNSADLTGFSNDVAMMIDPETGIAVSGRTASVALAMASLTAAGLALPRGVADGATAPWLVEFLDINGDSQLFKVTEGMPDRAIGLVTCKLEFYKR